MPTVDREGEAPLCTRCGIRKCKSKGKSPSGRKRYSAHCVRCISPARQESKSKKKSKKKSKPKTSDPLGIGAELRRHGSVRTLLE